MTIQQAFETALQHHQAGRLGEASGIYRQILAAQPQHPDSLHLLGVIEHQQGRSDVASELIRRAIALGPDVSIYHSNLGAALGGQGFLSDAVSEYRRALELNPQYAKAHNNLGSTLKDMGSVAEGIAEFRRALEIQRDYAIAHSSLVFSLHYLADPDAEAIFREHLAWDQVQARSLEKSIGRHANQPDPARRLKIGYVSADLRVHSVAFFFEGLLEGHNRTQVEAVCYADLQRPDQVTARLRQHAGTWRDIAGMGDEDVARMVHADGIDILVDLAGHTAGNRLLVFARKPAPVQVTYLGYCDTTGMRAMDYRLTDAHADPPGLTEHLHTEKLVRLPETFACFRPAESSPKAGSLPASARGYVTFGSFHTLAKLNDRLLEMWAAILNQVPGSRLLMVATGLGEAACQRRFIEFFGKRGIGRNRLDFRGRQGLAEYLALHNEVDVLLDSHPFSGHTVSCHALWMGVPVVTLAGRTHCARMVASVLMNVGRPEWIAETGEEYVRIACDLALDIPRLAALRSGLREEMASSPLTDAPRFARNVEKAYREMWRAWCASRGGGC